MDDSSPSIPESNPVSPVPASVTSGEDSGDAVDLSHLPAEHREAMQRLHRRVEEAAETIERLRAENRQLRERVDELEARPTFPEAETVLTLDDDPEELRDQITEFIDAIDTYLEAGPSDDEDAPTDEEPPAATDDPEA